MKTTNIIMTVLIVIIINLIFYQVFSDRTDKSLNNVPADFYTNNREEMITTYPVQQERLRDSDEYQLTRTNAVTKAVKMTEPTVVSVNVIKTQIVRRYTNPFDNPFFGFFDYRPYRREVQSIGSGIIFNPEGYIVTNSHVVEGATQIKVILQDQRQYEAQIVGMDSVLDIAILKIEAEGLTSARFGSSSDLLLGETAIAIGNPYAFLIKDSKPSVSVGVISATNRNFSQDTGGKIYQGMIQTDAAINPGNSGGPLINILGEIIGINTFIFSESGGNIGLGFAIPIDRVKRITNEIIKYGRRREIWFGFGVQDLNPMIASYLGLSDLNGVIVSILDNNSPAAAAGLQRGDIIRRIDNFNIRNMNDTEIAISEIAVGDKIELEVLRGNRTFMISFDAVELDRSS
ncbi:MAG: trypsin-like peptidase domain-containing protein [Candidatus Cloacimonetes bacterium]|nr:trypsin-like peptidase domain-containing protein [Candidatus Cloacimonadota bacterium]